MAVTRTDLHVRPPRPAQAAMTAAERQELAERFAPVLVLWPEIPAADGDGPSVRDRYSRQDAKSSTRKVTGAHIVRDYHPRDVRLILQNAHAYEPHAPLPFIAGVSFMRAYRDLAAWFFWPFLFLVALTLVMLAFATTLEPDIRLAFQIAIFAILSIVWLASFRSPIKVPTNNWHLINHTLVGTAMGVTWVAMVGPHYLLVPVIIAVPWLSSAAAWVLLRVRRLASAPLALMRLARKRRTEDIWTSFAGPKPAEQYSHQSELFFVEPGASAAMYRGDTAAHWSAYSKIIATGEYPRACYARVLDPDPDGMVTVQYWLCYYYNDWANDHEGDWESLVIFVREGEPVAAAASAHEGGEYRQWHDIEKSHGRPVFYVGAGSHALYFTPGVRLTQRDVLGLEVSSLDAALLGRSELSYMDFAPPSAGEGQVVSDLKVVLLPDPDPVSGRWKHVEHDGECGTPCLYDPAWLNYPGVWGARAFMGSGSSGPTGPAHTGLRWNDPRLWAEIVCKQYAGAGERGLAD